MQDAISKGSTARSLYQDLIWPAMDRVEQMYRDDRINQATEHLATRINRVVADHLQTSLRQNEVLGKRVLITCAHGEPEELGAQMCSDLFEAEGWDVYFLGGGVPDDEVLMLVGQLQPELLLIFGSQPIDAPAVRQMIDQIREIGSCPTMNVMVSGRPGVVFNDDDLRFFEAFANQAAIAIDNAHMFDAVRQENTYLKKEVQERYGFENIIGRSASMEAVFNVVSRVAASNMPVMPRVAVV